MQFPVDKPLNNRELVEIVTQFNPGSPARLACNKLLGQISRLQSLVYEAVGVRRCCRDAVIFWYSRDCSLWVPGINRNLPKMTNRHAMGTCSCYDAPIGSDSEAIRQECLDPKRMHGGSVAEDE